MDASVLNLLRDPAGIPFYAVVFQGLYILTWAFHALFVFLSLGAMGLSIYGTFRKKTNENWKILTGHLLQTGKISVSLLIVLGVAPLLFTQVIYDPNWYTVNALSGLWVVIFIYSLLVGYSIYYWYYYANKKDSSSSSFIGIISFGFLIFCGLIMHVFSVQAIQPDMWMQWYAPNGVVDTSGTTFNPEMSRFLFIILLSIPVVGLFLQNYGDFIKTNEKFTENFKKFTRDLGTKIATFGLILSLGLFVYWMSKINMLSDIYAIIIYVSFTLMVFLTKNLKNSYYTTAFAIILILLISGFREYLRYRLMADIGYDIYDYPVSIEWSSITMFVLTFVSFGAVGVSFIATLAWKVGKSKGVFDASKDKTVSLMANMLLWILSLWCVVYFAWGFFTLFKNSI